MKICKAALACVQTLLNFRHEICHVRRTSVAQYSMLCIAMISGRYFCCCSFPFMASPAGVVDVLEPSDVVELR